MFHLTLSVQSEIEKEGQVSIKYGMVRAVLALRLGHSVALSLVTSCQSFVGKCS